MDTLQVWQGFFGCCSATCVCAEAHKSWLEKVHKSHFFKQGILFIRKFVLNRMHPWISFYISFVSVFVLPIVPPFRASLPRDVASLSGGRAGSSVVCATALRKLASFKEEGKRHAEGRLQRSKISPTRMLPSHTQRCTGREPEECTFECVRGAYV